MRMLLCLVDHWPVLRQSLESITACHVLLQLNVHGRAGSMRRKDIQLFRISSCLVHSMVVGRKLLWFVDADCLLGRCFWAGFLRRAVVIVDIDIRFVWIKLYQWWLLWASIPCTFIGKTIFRWCTFCLCLTKTAIWVFFTSVAMFRIIFSSWCRW